MSSKVFYMRSFAIFMICLIVGAVLKISHVAGTFASVIIGIGFLCLLANMLLFIYQAFFQKRTS